MKTTIIFIRHAQSDPSVKDAKTRPLTEKGALDAQKLVERFQGVPISRILSSPYLRACQTVEPLAKARNLPLGTDERMREWMGGRPFASEFFESRMMRMFEDETDKTGGAESLRALKKRTLEFVMHLLTRFKGETLIVGTHALALTASVMNFDDCIGVDFLFRLLPVAPFAAVMEFENFTLTSMQFWNPINEPLPLNREAKS